MLHAVDDVSFNIDRARPWVWWANRAAVKHHGPGDPEALEPTAGSILFEGKDLARLNPRELREARKDLQIIFQDPSPA